MWGYFLDIHRSRGQTGYGPLAITSRDIVYWQIDAGRRLAPWERHAIIALDTAYLENVSESREAAAKRART